MHSPSLSKVVIAMLDSNSEPNETEVLAAAGAIVDAFTRTDTQAYFAGFDKGATFVFHSEARRLDNRAEYEREWASWLEEGWTVAECDSSNQLVQTFPGGAVFSHTVDTTVNTKGD